MDYYSLRGTHIWICQTCPIVMFEYYDEDDLYNLKRKLEEEQND